MEKYYTPEIEEFHVGFEYEQVSMKLAAPKQWYKEVFHLNTSHIDIIKYSSLDKNVRVKYLDKEDIESLGFVNVFDTGTYNKKIDNDIATIDFQDWEYINIYNFEDNKVFTGSIKNKSELKVLLKQLNIIE